MPYQIRETPGKAIVYPTSPDDLPLRTQDEAKIEMARLRGEARAEGRQVDFVMEKIPGLGGSTTPSGGATSIRLNEETRKRVARHIGQIMVDTGDMPSMGEAVVNLLDHYDRTRSLVNPHTQQLDEDAVVAMAKEILAARKAAKAKAEEDAA